MNASRNICTLALSLLVAGSTLAAHANSITIGSYVGASAVGLANTPLTYNNQASGTSETATLSSNGAVAGYQNSAYAAPLTGTAYVSFSADGGDGTGITYYTTTFTGNVYDAGIFNYMVDNDLGIVLNGHTVLAQGTTTTFGAFQGVNTVVLPNGDFVNGLNTLVIGVYNSGGPEALDFSASVATPEPGSLVLLGTGFLGLAGAARRRFKR